MHKILIVLLASLFAFPASAESVRQIVGKLVDFSNKEAPSLATMDVFNFGFGESDKVRICVKPGSVPVYFRFGTATADVTGITEYSKTNTNLGSLATAADYLTDRMTVPASSSSVFIRGQSGTYAFGRAIPMYASADSASSPGFTPHCTEQPWKTKGIVTHIASGLATVDIWGWKETK